MTELEAFRHDVRSWLSENCPKSMRQPVKGFEDFYSGGRDPEIVNPDQKVWCDRMAEKGIIHKNKAARHKSRLNTQIKALSK